MNWKNTSHEEFENYQVKKYFYGEKIGLSLEKLEKLITNEI